MHDKDVPRINMPSYYAGEYSSFGHVQPTNEDLLTLTDSDKTMIHGPTLFALKYRVLPCTMERCSFDEIERGGKQKQEGIYHATR
jgi:hypothetical protein